MYYGCTCVRMWCTCVCVDVCVSVCAARAFVYVCACGDAFSADMYGRIRGYAARIYVVALCFKRLRICVVGSDPGVCRGWFNLD